VTFIVDKQNCGAGRGVRNATKICPTSSNDTRKQNLKSYVQISTYYKCHSLPSVDARPLKKRSN